MISGNFADHPDFYSGFRTLLQDVKHLFVRDFGVVYQKLTLCSFEKCTERLAGICGADDKGFQISFILGTSAIRAEEFDSFPYPGGIGRHDSESAAVIDVHMGVLE